LGGARGEDHVVVEGVGGGGEGGGATGGVSGIGGEGSEEQKLLVMLMDGICEWDATT